MQMTIFNINFPKCIFLLSLRMSQISQDLLPKRVVLQVRYIWKNTIDVFIGIQYIANGYNSHFLLEMGALLWLYSHAQELFDIFISKIGNMLDNLWAWLYFVYLFAIRIPPPCMDSKTITDAHIFLEILLAKNCNNDNFIRNSTPYSFVFVICGEP